MRAAIVVPWNGRAAELVIHHEVAGGIVAERECKRTVIGRADDGHRAAGGDGHSGRRRGRGGLHGRLKVESSAAYALTGQRRDLCHVPHDPVDDVAVAFFGILGPEQGARPGYQRRRHGSAGEILVAAVRRVPARNDRIARRAQRNGAGAVRRVIRQQVLPRGGGDGKQVGQGIAGWVIRVVVGVLAQVAAGGGEDDPRTAGRLNRVVKRLRVPGGVAPTEIDHAGIMGDRVINTRHRVRNRSIALRVYELERHELNSPANANHTHAVVSYRPDDSCHMRAMSVGRPTGSRFR